MKALHVLISFLSGILILIPSTGQSVNPGCRLHHRRKRAVGSASNYEQMIDFIIKDVVDPTQGVIPSSPSVRLGALAYASTLDTIYELDSVQDDGRVALIDALTEERSDYIGRANSGGGKPAVEAARDMLNAENQQDGRARTIIYFQVGPPAPSFASHPCRFESFVSSLSGIEFAFVQIQDTRKQDFKRAIFNCLLTEDASNFKWVPNFGALDGSVATEFLSGFIIKQDFPSFPFGYQAPTLPAPSITLYATYGDPFVIFEANPDDPTSNNGDRAITNNAPLYSDVENPGNSIIGYQNGVCTFMNRSGNPLNMAQYFCNWYITFVSDPTNSMLFLTARVMDPPGDEVVQVDADPEASSHGDGIISGGTGAFLGVDGYIKSRRYVGTDGKFLWQYDFYFLNP